MGDRRISELVYDRSNVLKSKIYKSLLHLRNNKSSFGFAPIYRFRLYYKKFLNYYFFFFFSNKIKLNS